MKVAIIGGGPSGFMAAIAAKEQNPDWDIIIFERAKPLASLLYTGGGRCNITNAEFDFKELAAHYPRGEKFLYSIFSRFDVASLFEFFEKIGLELYIQDDNRVFPKSDKADDIRDALLVMAKAKGVKIQALTKVTSLEKDEEFIINNKFYFDKVVLATGGRNSFAHEAARSFGHGVSELAPVLCGMKVAQPLASLAGVSVKNVLATAGDIELRGDLLFTHKGVSGPVIFDLSSYLAFEKFPILLKLNFSGLSFEEQDAELIRLLGESPKKNISNLLAGQLPSALLSELLSYSGILADKKSHEINSVERKKIAEFLSGFEMELVAKDTPAMVTAGGVNLDEIDKNLQSKLVEGLYFCGEILNIDGLCGGYNLQACFSTGYVVGSSMKD